ncbi:MAG TPA: CBS domain-containing protein [Labilithrix sp.]|nr:CBS domain-containing protein [Labilithrix sp.]
MSANPVALVREFMTASVVSVTEDAPLEEVAKTLLEFDVSCVLVTTAACAPSGVVSLTDLARASRLEGGPRNPLKIMPPNRRAKEIMKTPVLSVGDDATVSEAASKMIHNQVHRLFVTRTDRVIGVFSTRDALRVAFFRHIETPLRAVMSAPVETVLLGDSIDDAIAKLDESNRRGLVVLDGTFPVGVFTQMEAIRARSLTPGLRRNPVEEVMSYESATLDASTPLYRAAAQVIATRVRRILVVEGRQLVGIVSGYDLARTLV